MDEIQETATIGEEYKVGEFSHIPEGDLIGFTSDAIHGHQNWRAGSIDVDCRVRVISNDLNGNLLAGHI